MYTFKEIPGKGNGVIATQKIPMGTRILSEIPILVIPTTGQLDDALLADVAKQVANLADHQRGAFLSMCNIYPYDNDTEKHLGIARTVALPMSTSDGERGGVFLEAGLLNHACDNNAQKDWNENIQHHTVHALRDIEEGEEITIYYLTEHRDRRTRQAALWDKLKFTCSCRLCSLPPAESDAYDKKLERINELDGLIHSEIASMQIAQVPSRALRYVEEQVRLYNELDPNDAGLPRAYADAALISLVNSDLARGHAFLQRALVGWIVSSGADSKQVICYEASVKDPTKHCHYGLTKAWKTTLEDGPGSSGPEAIENWLWQRLGRVNMSTALESGEGVSWQNATFAFGALPRENDAHPAFYTVKNASRAVFRPCRHWCFVGEITEVTKMLRTELYLKDADSQTIPFLFYTDGRGSEVDPALLKVGHTVVALYAEKHDFVYGPPGIRHEDTGRAKIIPLSLSKLLALGDNVLKYATKQDGAAICHGCGETGMSLKACARCLCFSYCNKDCQATGWNTKGHKESCKILKDRDVKGLLTMDWGHFHDFVRFPLSS